MVILKEEVKKYSLFVSPLLKKIARDSFNRTQTFKLMLQIKKKINIC